MKLCHSVIPEPLQKAALDFYLAFNALQLLKNYSLCGKTEENWSFPNVITNKYVCLCFPSEVTGVQIMSEYLTDIHTSASMR